MKLPIIGGREAVPVRLLPFATAWTPLSPDRIASMFNGSHPWHSWSLTSHQFRIDAPPLRLRQRDWDGVQEKLQELEAALTARDAPASEWEAQSLPILPAAWFVWRDELEAEYAKTQGPDQVIYVVPRPGAPEMSEAAQEAELDRLIELGNTPGVEADKAIDQIMERAKSMVFTRDGDGELQLDAALTNEIERVVFEGFPRVERVPVADVARVIADANAKPIADPESDPEFRRSIDWLLAMQAIENDAELCVYDEQSFQTIKATDMQRKCPQRYSMTRGEMDELMKRQGVAMEPFAARHAVEDFARNIGGPAEDLEGPNDRRKRRLQRFKTLGGVVQPVGDTWRLVGKRGALASLVREEQEASRPMSKRQDVTRELHAASAEQMQG
jgi:hypothetical protein